jgi:hypothetical protein
LAIHKTSVPTNNKRITPGSINGCRIAVKNDSEFVVACNNELFYLTVDLKEAAEQFSHDSRSQISKFIPIATPLKQETKLTATHPYEIQNIFYKSANGQDYLYSVDMAGNSKFHILENSQIKNTVSVGQSETKRPELGWCGIIPTVHDAEKTVTARFFDKKITVADKDRVIRTFQPVQHPTQIGFLPTLDLLCVTEYNMLSVWDLRQGEKFGCIKRTNTLREPLYALACTANNVSVSGAARDVITFDTHKWNIRARWNSCLKYEVTSLHLSSVNENLCYVSGLGSELLCGDWRGSSSVSHREGFHAESRWLGVQQHAEDDTMVGFTEAGSVYVFKNGVSMIDLAIEEKKQNHKDDILTEDDEHQNKRQKLDE